MLLAFRCFSAGLFLAALASLAMGQGLPDGLDGPTCCALASPALPRFPAVSQPALGICFLNCGVEATRPHTVVWRVRNLAEADLATTGVECSALGTTLELRDPDGNLQWSGRMRLVYARTWMETTSVGASLQVWRFLVNGDLVPTGFAGTTPCPVPPCASAFQRVKFSGHIDWARDVDTQAWQSAWMLTHACDAIDHHSGFPRSGSYHPDRSYSLVGPAAGFVPDPLVPAEAGGSSLDASRRLVLPPPDTIGPTLCLAREGMTHVLAPSGPFCLGSAGPGQWSRSGIVANGDCGTSLSEGLFLFPGLLSMGIGSWTDPDVYPGLESVRWNVAEWTDSFPCSGPAIRRTYQGVTTLGGNLATQVSPPGSALPSTFLDQASSLTRRGGRLLNTPSFCDHVLSLNQ